MSSYQRESLLDSRAADGDLVLETASGITPTGAADHPSFFSGFVDRPDVLAAGLLAVADVAATSYFDLSASRASLDPVVTASGDRLRFESFSRCNGVYARLDLLGSVLQAGRIGFGTTNVDINSPLRTMLATVEATRLLHLSVGAEALLVSTPEQSESERRVELPDRWVRGFAEVPVIAEGMEPAGELDRAGTMRFLGGLPRATPGPSLHLSFRGGVPRTEAMPAQCAIHLAGTARLTAARRVMRFVRRTIAFRHVTDASSWVFELEGGRLTLALTAEPFRGFSGEGALLHDLGRAETTSGAVLEHLAWDPVIDPARLADVSGLAPAEVRSGLAVLAASGRVGYDLADAAWFHRELPIDDDRVLRDNPRLAKARRIVAGGSVAADGERWRVDGEGSRHWVVPYGDRLACTCPWEARHSGTRGPCAHILAVELLHPESRVGRDR